MREVTTDTLISGLRTFALARLRGVLSVLLDDLNLGMHSVCRPPWGYPIYKACHPALDLTPVLLLARSNLAVPCLRPNAGPVPHGRGLRAGRRLLSHGGAAKEELRPARADEAEPADAHDHWL